MQPGDVIAQRYRLERLLGRGGMGAVWAATHVITRRAVALKLLRPRDDDETARRRVLREARAACAVQHPSVVSVHDVVEADDGAPVLVMDLLDGESLRARLDRERTLPLAEARRIAETVLDALDVAHAAGIVHRDLKPDNLFLLRDGRVMLLDFGVAKLVAADGPAAGTSTLTATGAMVGTPFYMAPEQAFGEPIDGRADLWAVGVVLYECLAGEPPTRGENLGQVLRILSTGKIAPLRTRAPDVPEAVARVVDGLLSIDTGGRPASARAALEALRAAAEQATASAAPSGEVPASEVSVDEAPAGEAPVNEAPTSARAPLTEAASTPAVPAPRARKGILGAGIGVAVAGIAAVLFMLMTVRVPAPPASSPALPAVVVSTAPIAATPPSAAPIADIPTAAPSPTASAAAPAPRPVRSAKPAPSASPAASASGAPRLLTDVPF